MTAALISAQITIPRVVPMNKSPILEPFDWPPNIHPSNVEYLL